VGSARALWRGAIIATARAIIVGHNHPSGDPTPSSEDLAMTLDLVRAGNVIGIMVLDHIVVTRNERFASILECKPEIFE